MEGNLINIDFNLIEDMVEDDMDFRNQLLDAIEVAVKELEEGYIKGIAAEDLHRIKQARHKIKPTLGLFGLKRITNVLAIGKVLIAEKGFGIWLDAHKVELKAATSEVLVELKNYR